MVFPWGRSLNRLLCTALAVSNICCGQLPKGKPTGLGPLYERDPHDVQRPSFPPPTCFPATQWGFRIPFATNAVQEFCSMETTSVSAMSQGPLSRAYHSPEAIIKITLSWDNSGTCSRTHSWSSPSDMYCEEIIMKSVRQCKIADALEEKCTKTWTGPCGLACSTGGWIIWNCAIWSIGLEENDNLR